MPLTATATPAAQLLTPTNHALVLIDFQSQMAFATRSIDAIELRNNAGLVAHAAAGFKVPTILTTVAEKSFSGPMFSEVTEAFPGKELIDRTSMNFWEDVPVVKTLNAIGKDRLVLGGLWTSVCIVDPVLSALAQGYEVYVITDACGDVSVEAHERAIQRMVQAGAHPMTALQYLLELQRDWARSETYALTTGIASRFGARTDWASSTPPQCLAATKAEASRRLPMKPYLLSLAAGLLVGVIYAVLNVRSPAPPVIALVGLLGILVGEQIPPLVRKYMSPEQQQASWLQHQVKPHMFGELPRCADTDNKEPRNG